MAANGRLPSHDLESGLLTAFRRPFLFPGRHDGWRAFCDATPMLPQVGTKLRLRRRRPARGGFWEYRVMPELTDEDDRFWCYRVAHWLDRGFSVEEAMSKARAELPIKDLIGTPGTPQPVRPSRNAG